MEQLIQQVLETARAMWRRRWIGVAVAWGVALLGAVVLSITPNRYEASGRVYVETKSVLRPLLHDLAVEPDMDQTIGLLARTLITRPNVEMLMRTSNLETPGMSPIDRERMINGLMREIKVAASGRDNVFTFSYRDKKPERARLVVQNLLNLFLASDTGAKRRDAESAREFIDDQIKSYEQRLAEAENRLKEFKVRNLGVTDLSGRDYFARIGTLSEELGKLTVELRAAQRSREAFRQQLDGETMSLVPDVPPANAALTSEVDARLDAQRKQLDDLLRRYTEAHPDVVAARHLIARLEEERQRELEAKRRAAASKPARSNNVSPVMQHVKLALAEADANVASLSVRVGDTQARLSQMRAQATKVPQVEAELAQLNRDYDVIRRTYETMVARREKASLSEDMDATRTAQFRVIDPPRTAEQPVSPNRLALAPAILILSLIAGGAACFAFVQLMPTIDNARSLRSFTQRPVLGSVAMLVDAGMAKRARQNMVAFGSALGSLLLMGVVWVAWLATRLHA